VTAPDDGQEWWQWATRVEEEYQAQFGEPVQAEMFSTASPALEAEEEALNRDEPIDYPDPPPGADF